MTYSELEALVDNLFVAGDYDGIIELITEENVQTAVACNGKPGNFDFNQRLTRPNEMLQDYIDLKASISGAPSSAWVMSNAFKVEHINMANIGMEFMTAVQVATERFTEQGYGAPGTTAETRVDEDYDVLTEVQNPELPQPC